MNHSNIKYIEIHWTCEHLEEAKHVAFLALKAKLVGCVQILPKIESIFLWKDKLEEQKETKVIFKTRQEHFDKVKELILAHAKYEIPEILALPIIFGHEKYLSWLDECIGL